MDNTLIVFAMLILVVLGLIAVTLKIAISGNVKVSQRLRGALLERLDRLPFKRMLKKRNVDVSVYIPEPLPEETAADIEKQLRNCETCTVVNECEESLAKEDAANQDYSYCPNDDSVKSIEKNK